MLPGRILRTGGRSIPVRQWARMRKFFRPRELYSCLNQLFTVAFIQPVKIIQITPWKAEIMLEENGEWTGDLTLSRSAF